MKISVTWDLTHEARRAINFHNQHAGLATREDAKRFIETAVRNALLNALNVVKSHDAQRGVQP